MQPSMKTLLAALITSSTAAVLSFWWWSSLIARDFSACVANSLPVGVDCDHDPQMYAALFFASLALAILLVAVTRGSKAYLSSRQSS